MLKSSFIGALITLALILLPIVHFLTVWFASFLGGFVAGSRISATQADAIRIGATMSILLILPIIGVISISSTIFSMNLDISLIFVLSLLVTLYVAGLGTLGASLGGSMARKVQH